MEKREALIRTYKLRVKIWQDLEKWDRILGDDVNEAIGSYDEEIDNIIREIYGIDFEDCGWYDYISDVIYYLATGSEIDNRGPQSVEELVDEILNVSL